MFYTCVYMIVCDECNEWTYGWVDFIYVAIVRACRHSAPMEHHSSRVRSSKHLNTLGTRRSVWAFLEQRIAFLYSKERPQARCYISEQMRRVSCDWKKNAARDKSGSVFSWTFKSWSGRYVTTTRWLASTIKCKLQELVEPINITKRIYIRLNFCW